MNGLFRRYGFGPGTLIVALVVFWLVVLVVLPNVYMIQLSFHPYIPAAEIGGPNDRFTLNNYLTMFRGDTTRNILFLSFPIHVYVLLQTIFYSLIATLVCLVAAYPVGHFLAVTVSDRARPILLILLVIPLLVSDLLRTFAWYVILAFQGPLNALIGVFGFKAIRWINGFNAITATLIYGCILFMVIPIYNAIATLDRNQVEAAEDLGARRWQIHRDIIMPHAKAGIASGCTMVFMFSVGSILTPTLLASPDSRWFTEIIQQWMSLSNDWNTAAAYSFILLIVCTLFVSLVMRLFRVSLNQIVK